MAADAAQIQQLLANLQNQIATVSSMAGQLGTYQAPTTLSQVGNNNPDIAAIVKATVAAELRNRVPAMAPNPTNQAMSQAPVQAPMQASALFPSSPQLTQAQQPVPQLAQPQAQPQEAQMNSQVATPISQQSMQEVMMRDFMNQLKLAIGGALSVDQQRWISGNLFGLPEFFKTQEGKDSVVAVLTRYHQYVESQPK